MQVLGCTVTRNCIVQNGRCRGCDTKRQSTPGQYRDVVGPVCSVPRGSLQDNHHHFQIMWQFPEES